MARQFELIARHLQGDVKTGVKVTGNKLSNSLRSFSVPRIVFVAKILAPSISVREVPQYPEPGGIIKGVNESLLKARVPHYPVVLGPVGWDGNSLIAYPVKRLINVDLYFYMKLHVSSIDKTPIGNAHYEDRFFPDLKVCNSDVGDTQTGIGFRPLNLKRLSHGVPLPAVDEGLNNNGYKDKNTERIDGKKLHALGQVGDKNAANEQSDEQNQSNDNNPPHIRVRDVVIVLITLAGLITEFIVLWHGLSLYF
jgi:hypothetical protein